MYCPSLVLADIVHLHGHRFQVLYRSGPGVGHFNPCNPPVFYEDPVQRDVLLVNGGGYAVIAFRADNPGVWFLYTHSYTELTLAIVILIGMSLPGWPQHLLKLLFRCRRTLLFLHK